MEPIYSRIKRYFTKKVNVPEQAIIDDLSKQDSNSISGKFIFLGVEYSLSDLNKAKLIKPYHKLRYEEIGLYQDCFGRMFIKTSRDQIESEGKKNPDYQYLLLCKIIGRSRNHLSK
jgi:hypothetical protein